METSVFSAFNQNVNAQQKQHTGYEFDGIQNLYADNFGNFWYNGERIEKHYRPYQVYLLINGKQIGINTLRKLARKTFIDFMPF